MILKTAYLEIKDPTEYCPFLHGEIHFSNDTKCPIYSKSDGEFVIQRAKEFGLIDDIGLTVLGDDIKKSNLLPEMYFNAIDKDEQLDLKVPFELMITGLLEEALREAKKGETMEIDLVSHVQEKFKKIIEKRNNGEGKSTTIYNA